MHLGARIGLRFSTLHQQETIYPNIERAQVEGNPDTTMPRLGDLTLAAEDTITEEAAKECLACPRQTPPEDEVQVDKNHVNGNPEPNNGPQTPVIQDPAASSAGVQTIAIFANGFQTGSLQALYGITATNRQTGDPATSIPPPAAPDSILWSLQPSGRAKNEYFQLSEPSVISRLVSACVILLRQGNGAEARKLGQFTIDLIGEEAWNEYLPIYMDAPSHPSDREQIMTLLYEAMLFMRHVDETSSAFLNGMLYVWT